MSDIVTSDRTLSNSPTAVESSWGQSIELIKPPANSAREGWFSLQPLLMVGDSHLPCFRLTDQAAAASVSTGKMPWISTPTCAKSTHPHRVSRNARNPSPGRLRLATVPQKNALVGGVHVNFQGDIPCAQSRNGMPKTIWDVHLPFFTYYHLVI